MDRQKKTLGKQPIKMEKIESQDDRLITFSKRKSGIYKKCSELATLCGAEVGVVIFSPSKKPYSFGQPSIGYIANRFLGRNNQQNYDSTQAIVDAHRKVILDETKQKHNQILEELQFEKERGKMMEKMEKERGGVKQWWDIPLETLSLEELQQIHSSFQVIRDNLANHLNERSAFGASSSSSMFHAVGSSNQMPSTFANPLAGSNVFATNDNSDIQPSTLPQGGSNEEGDGH